jgi:hypothetical protein
VLTEVNSFSRSFFLEFVSARKFSEENPGLLLSSKKMPEGG